MKNYKYLAFSLLVIIGGIGFSILKVPNVYATNTTPIKYPVTELGNCQNKNACKQYCSVSAHYLACTNFGEKNNLISKADAARSKKFVNVLKSKGPGGCQDETTCKNYCAKPENLKTCFNFSKENNLISAEQLKEMADGVDKLRVGFGQAPPAVQGCFKSLISSIGAKIKGGTFKGQSDIMSALMQNCLPSGTKIPSGASQGINMEALKKMQEFYGKNLPAKDLESLKNVQEQLNGIIPQGTAIPSGQNTLNLEDIQEIQAKMEADLKNIPPEYLEQMKKMQEQGQFENATPSDISGGGSGMGL